MWESERLVFPVATIGPEPTVDLPEDLKTDYNEARDIMSRSPRGAAALLRLVLQSLLKQLGAPGNNLYEDIGVILREKGLPEAFQKAADIVRIVGNNALHPGELDIRDDIDSAIQLCTFINRIVYHTISHPKQIDQFYAMLPEGAREGVELRKARGDAAKPPDGS